MGESKTRAFQAVRVNHRIRRQNDRALDDMLQFTDIARPRVLLQRGERVGCDPIDFLAKLRRVFHGKAQREHRNILNALPQRRDQYGNRRQPIVQILAERAVIGVIGQVAIGGGHDADIHLYRRGAAHTFKFLFLQHPQQLRLKVQTHLGHFVQQQCAAVGAFKGAFNPLYRTGKGSLFVAKQGRFDEPFRQRGAIELDERTVPSIALIVNGACEQLFARPRLALQQHSRAGGRGHGHRLKNAADAG